MTEARRGRARTTAGKTLITAIDEQVSRLREAIISFTAGRAAPTLAPIPVPVRPARPVRRPRL